MSVDSGGDERARFIVSSNIASLDPILPPTFALKHIMRPFFPSFSLTTDCISSTPTFSASRSSSLPHSIPLCTREQWARCNDSSSGAPRVYERPQIEQVRRTEVSREKWSCLRTLCFGFSVLPEGDVLDDIRFFVGGSFSVPSPRCLRFVLDGGDDDGGEDGSDSREREL